jgi:hypothetical protein
MRISSIMIAAALVGAGTQAGSAASVVKSIDVMGKPAEIWSAIGPFCAIKDWHPAIGECTSDGKSPPTRTLVTKDGKATFIETQTGRDDKDYTYSYAIKSSPLPLTGYKSTITIKPKGADMSTITWKSTFTPNPGQDAAASDAVGGIYQAGLDSVKAKMAK